jgi:hypothetical protein
MLNNLQCFNGFDRAVAPRRCWYGISPFCHDIGLQSGKGTRIMAKAKARQARGHALAVPSVIDNRTFAEGSFSDRQGVRANRSKSVAGASHLSSIWHLINLIPARAQV